MQCMGYFGTTRRNGRENWGHLHLRFVPTVSNKSSPQMDAVGSAEARSIKYTW